MTIPVEIQELGKGSQVMDDVIGFAGHDSGDLSGSRPTDGANSSVVSTKGFDPDRGVTRYRGYEITVGPCYTPDSRWQFIHKDYDGPEDDRIGLAASIDDCKAEIDCQIEEIMFAALNAAAGYLRNAQIDLETGAPKATAIRTIKGGLVRVESAIRAASAGEAGTAETVEQGSVHEHATAEGGDAQNTPSPSTKRVDQ